MNTSKSTVFELDSLRFFDPDKPWGYVAKAIKLSAIELPTSKFSIFMLSAVKYFLTRFSQPDRLSQRDRQNLLPYLKDKKIGVSINAI